MGGRFVKFDLGIRFLWCLGKQNENSVVNSRSELGAKNAASYI